MRHYYRLACLLCFASLTLLCTTSGYADSQQQNVYLPFTISQSPLQVISTRIFGVTSGRRDCYIPGIVKNVSSTDVYNAVVTGVVYDEQYNELSRLTTRTMLSYIKPDQQSPFRLRFENCPSNAINYRIQTSIGERNGLWFQLPIDFERIYQEVGYQAVQVLLRNDQNVAVLNTEVAATFYDQDNNIVDAISGFATDPENSPVIEPQEQGDAELEIVFQFPYHHYTVQNDALAIQSIAPRPLPQKQ